MATWAPQPGPQTEAICADWCPELFYGGAAGGGKSDFLLGDFLQDVPTYGQAWQGVIFRRTYPELEELIKRSLEMYPGSGGTWLEQKKLWQWPNGATLKMRYLEADRDCSRYQGHQYTWIGWDELTQWATLHPYRYLRARLRSAHDVPTKRIRAAANPGGAGHLEVKGYFVDPNPGGYRIIRDDETGLERMYIPARLTDNVLLQQADPGYEARLRGLGSKTLVKAWLEGDWSIVEGAFFDEWSHSRHVITPFEIPSDWDRFRSIDWGSASPASIGWWAIARDDYRIHGRVIPRGCLVRYREWYVAGADRKGLKLTAEQMARGILAKQGEREPALIKYTVMDPAAFAEDGGPSIAERMRNAGVACRPADNKRVGGIGAIGGWDQMRQRLRGDAEGRPMLVVFSTCGDFIRTVPVLQHDETHPEDVNTESEDHVGDEARYACMSRPMVSQLPKPKPQNPTFMADPTGRIVSNMTIADLIKQQQKAARR